MGPPHSVGGIEGKEGTPFDGAIDGSMAGDAVAEQTRRKKSSASSQANDTELRRLFKENEGRDLHDVAQQVIKDEKGPKAEKTKQIFGMLWYGTCPWRCEHD